MRLVASIVLMLWGFSGVARAEAHDKEMQLAWDAMLADAAQAEQRSTDLAGQFEALIQRLKGMPGDDAHGEFETMDAPLRWGFVSARFKDLTKTLKKHDPRKCFGTSKLSKQCKEQISRRCNGLMGRGALFGIMHTRDPFEVEPFEIESYDDYLWSQRERRSLAPETETRFRYEFCRAVAHGTTAWTAFPFTADEPLWVQKLWGMWGTADEFAQSCTKTASYGEEETLRKLIETEVDDYSRKRLQRWLDSAARQRDECTRALQLRCGDVQFIRDVPVLSYCTVSGRIHEVTEQDVRNAARRMATEAAGLKHLELVDDLQFCADTRAAGFSWHFDPPAKRSCKPDRD